MEIEALCLQSFTTFETKKMLEGCRIHCQCYLSQVEILGYSFKTYAKRNRFSLGRCFFKYNSLNDNHIQ